MRNLVLCADAFSPEVDARLAEYGYFPLIICDPPYGDIVDEEWDRRFALGLRGIAE